MRRVITDLAGHPPALDQLRWWRVGPGTPSGVERAPRFEVRAEIGRGAVGVVSRAYDRERRIEVALKTLRLPTGAHLYRFKREFRLLADILHRNLVTLYELQSIGDEWLISMELIDGIHFIDHVRPIAEDPAELPAVALVADDATQPSPRRAGTKAPARPRGPVDLQRLRPALRQLADAVAHLHDAGKLHCDLKPSNVLVEPGGRLVVCDFGLVVETHGDRGSAGAPRLVGTPGYVSPEQAAAGELTAASDWYSVGVMLHEALTGRLPFEGSPEEMVEQKQTRAAPAIEPVPEGAGDLAELCMALLARDPTRRPDAAAIVGALELGPGPGRAPSAEPAPFVGRSQELAFLYEALAEVGAAGRSVAVFVHGDPGSGKTELVQQFLSELRAGDGAGTVILGGKCYEREQLPYKALDPIIDALSGYLSSPGRGALGALPPDDAACLARLFPVLERIPSVAAATATARELGQVPDSRRRAFAALRDLLARLAETRRLILFIDDLQWGDADSAPFLRELIHHPDAPALLLVGTYRAGDVAVSPMLQRLRPADPRGLRGDVREIAVPPLPRAEAIALAEQLLATGAAAGRLAAIVAEGRGNPLFLIELARAGGGDGSPNLEAVLERRIRRLSQEDRRFLTVVALAARPLSAALAGQAAGVANEAAVLATLGAERMIRVSFPGERLEVYHDQIGRAALRLSEPAEIQGLHRRLACLLEERGAGEPGSLADHWLGAGEPRRAGPYARQAAARAEAAFAFHRAAHYHRLVREIDGPRGVARGALERRLADALVNCGHLPEAAEAYLAAEAHAPDEQSWELRRLALEQYLRAGLSARARAIGDPLGRELGVPIPRGRRRALLAIAAGRARVALRELRFRERPEAEIDRAALDRVDVCWSLVSGLGFDDPITGVAVQTHHVRHALAAGEVYRVVRALSAELCYRALTGDVAGAEKLAPRVLELAERIHDTRALGHATAGVAMGAFISGRWRRAEELLGRAGELLSRRPDNVRWEADLAVIMRMAALVNLGAMKELTRSLPTLVREAEEQGNVHAANGLRAWRSNIAWLAMGDPDEARRQWRLGSVREQTSERHPHEYYDVVSNVRIDLYRGDAPAAWERIDEAWADGMRIMLARFPNPSIEIHFLRARAALSMAAAGRDAKRMLAVAAGCARKLARSPLAWGPACGALVRGCIALQRGDLERADLHLVRAVIGFDRCDMALVAQVARRTRGALIGGSEGAALVSAAEAWMRAQTIADPASMSRMFVPTPLPTEPL